MNKQPKKQQAFARSSCPVACTLDVLGDKWTLLIIRDLFAGKKKYGEFQNSPERIPSNILANRLARLVAQQIVNKQAYQDKPVRYEYILTEKGKALGTILQPMVAWGETYFAGSKAQMQASESKENLMHISHIDHLVLTVADIDATASFYQRILGMQIIHFGEGRTALQWGKQKINLHESHSAIEPKAKLPTVGSADICLITTTPLAQAMRHVQDCGVSIVQGPVMRTGARNALQSFYFYDPNGNLIEIANEMESEV